MQDHMFAKSGVPANGAGLGQNYYTRDLITEVPTIIQIVPVSSEALATQRSPPKGTSDTFKISLDDVEPTAGWLSDRNNASLDICFMHSFGKCYGKIREKDPRTCHQIHVKRNVLDNLRKYYTNPQRNYFCRTMKANVTEKFAQVLSLLARRRIGLRYLEFRTEDIEVTAGSTEYEVQYRLWLVSDVEPQSRSRAQAANILTDNFISSSNLCWDFALTGRCCKGASCPDLHGHVAKALTKDRYVKAALAEMGKKDSLVPPTETTQPGKTPRVCQPSTSAPQQFPPPPPMPQQCASFIVSSPISPPYCFSSLPAASGMSAPSPNPTLAAFPLDMSSLQGTPCFLVDKGSDNVFRLITQSQFASFGNDAS
ncbi:hypothetical protein LMJF_32_0030 [Leishmania major strain Friedlin]|uniref:C3H1-type domain-containing protein n=1 Tax=Leishmania major TaxID=5664 RepID=Q4Q5T3_LEIMA|nr:hypothetical protein LMJF_32_0030 [Leishmania major strain Friedlin]CAG9579918.1 hypothetical_protein_-_conserved [Leishmania major strain Friedlin]CAJ08436.1 hypothetical protein LMJF_32_0030 [Leishmania major strain Friedlin]|eukprot:XP_001685315.1 hypothetical protein LMJF_32_0030 [Leishmania major strain Friedlin]